MMFTITAIVLLLFGLLSFFAPPALAGTDVTAGFSAKISGVIMIALGVMAWLVRNAEPSKTRDAVVLGYILLFALWACVSLYGVFLVDMPSHTISWVPALLQALIAIGFVVAGRANMSTSVS
ncbi:MAG: hypothetical protein ACK2UP_21985 [Candidatus Promineifilaceae bacterium]